MSNKNKNQSVDFGNNGNNAKKKEASVTINLKAVDALMKTDIRTAATVSKLTGLGQEGSRVNGITTASVTGSANANLGQFGANHATCDFLKLFPELKTALLTLVSLTLSPRNSTNSEVTYIQKKKVLPSTVSLTLMRQVTDHLEDVWDVRNSMYDILVDCAMGPGAVCKVIVPENTLDHIINGKCEYSQENMSPLIDGSNTIIPLNLLGGLEARKEHGVFEALETPMHQTKPSELEEIMCMEVVDNYNMLKLPQVKEKVRKNARKKIIDSRHIYGLNPRKQEEEITYIRSYSENEREAIGAPMVLDIDPASLILVTSPIDVSKRLGAFVMVSEDGLPVTVAKREQDDKAEKKLMEQINKGLVGHEITQVDASKWTNGNKDEQSSNANTNIGLYMETGLKILTAKLTNGLYGSGVNIAEDEQFFQILFTRALADKKTRLVFVPNELLAYFYLDLSDLGMGKNLLEDYNDLNSLRAALLYAEVDSAITANIQHTEVMLDIDEDDPDPRGTKDIAMVEIARARQKRYPKNMSKHGDLVKWLQDVSLSVKTSEVPGLPTTNLTYETIDSTRTTAEFSEVNERLRDQVVTGILGDPSLLDSEGNVMFASVEEDKRMLTAKKIRVLQVKVQQQWSDYIRTLTYNDGNQRKDLKITIKKELKSIRKVMNYKKGKFGNEEQELEHIFSIFVENLAVELPNPVLSDFTGMMDELETYIQGLDTVMPYWISDEIYDEKFDGEAAELADVVAESWTALFVRDWMAEHGFMTELSRMVATESIDGRIDLGKEVAEHKKGLFSNIKSFVEESLRNQKAHKKIRGIDDLIDKVDDADDADDQYSDDVPNEDTKMPEMAEDDIDMDEEADKRSKDETSKDKDVTDEADLKPAPNKALPKDAEGEEVDPTGKF